MTRSQCRDSHAADLVHEGKELVEEIWYEWLDAGQIIFVKCIHQIPECSHSIHPDLHWLCNMSSIA